MWENVSQSLLDIVTPTISNYLGTFYGNTEILTRYYPGHGTAQNRDPRDRRQGYSSFISGSIALPLQQMEDFCGATLALEAFERAAAGGDDLQEQVERTAGFLRATVNPTVLLPELLAGQAPRVGAIVVGDDVGTALAQFTAQTNQDRQLLQRVGAVIQEKKTALARTAKAALEQYARGVLAQHGPGSAVRALDLLSGAEAIPNASAQQQRCSLRQFAEYLANSAAAAIAEANKSLAGQQAALTELGGQGMMAMFNRVRAQESGRRAAITSAVAARDRWLAAELEGRARTALAEVAAQLGADARTLRADMEIAARGLSRSQGQLHADLRALAKGDAIPGSYNMDADYEMGISVVEIPMMSRIYEELTTEDDRRQAIDSLRERLAGRPLEHFKSLATGESEARDLATQFRKDCALFFRDRLRNQDVLDYLTRSHPDRNPQQVVGEAIMDIRQRALPLWRYDKNRLGGELEHLAIIGVADATDPRVPAWMHDQGESFQVRSTNVRWRIDLLHIRHGVPIGLLANAAEWRQSYDETSGGALPTHIIDHANLQDIIPPSVAPRIFGGEQMFVVGMALTWIGKVGASYYLDVAGDIKNKIAPPPERLIADGRVGAMETFSRNSTWVAEGAALTQRLLRQFGQAKIFEQLEAYFQDLTDELRRATPGGDQAAQCRKELDLLRQYIEAQRG
ncbi:MAG: hypothetical protein NTZ05_17815 [Chloroflexi bacterium]|nr:hypothetical protein [Chloroflexota bacterium]